MKKIHKIIKNHWQKQGVKFKVSKEKSIWIKTLRSVDCAICKKHLVEKREDEGFDNWRIMPEIINPQGKAPEICPDCAKKFNLPFRPARRAQCKKCGITQKEKIFGIGFPGWLIAPGEQNKGLLKGFCPNCYINFIAPSIPQFIHSTWYDLTFASGSLLTSTKMTQLDGNFDALAAQETGAPVIDHGAISGLSDDDHTQYLNTARHDTTERHGSSVVDHGSIGGLADDDHTQYLNTTRHDTTDRHPVTVLKKTTASFSFSISAETAETNDTAVNAYALASPQVKWSENTKNVVGEIYNYMGANDLMSNLTSYVRRWSQYANNVDTLGRTAYTLYDYLQSSPPYEIEHFIYLLLDPDGSIKGAWEAEDPPWKGQGFNEEATEEDLPHPFLSKKEDQKVILINPSQSLIDELKNKRKQFKKGILEFINEGEYMINDVTEKARGPMTEKIIAKGVEFRKLVKVK